MRKNKSAFIFLLAALVLAVAGMGLGGTPRAHAQAAYGITPTAEAAPTDTPLPPPTDTPPAPTAPPATAAPGATSTPAPQEATPEPAPAILPESGGALAPNLHLVLLAGLALVLSGLLAFKSNPGASSE